VRDDRGTGLVSTLAGVTVFLAFCLFAVQLLVGLYATSVVTSVAYDAARSIATSGTPASDDRLAEAEAGAREQLGRYGDQASFEWDVSDPDVVRLRVRAVNPRFLWPQIDRLTGADAIDRTVTVRVERADR
jgi:hypothetical protein